MAGSQMCQSLARLVRRSLHVPKRLWRKLDNVSRSGVMDAGLPLTLKGSRIPGGWQEDHC
jgi:hypothetical protein